MKIPETVNVAIFATYKSNEKAIDDVCHYIENNLTDIIQLPELFFIDEKSTMNNADNLKSIELICEKLINRIKAVLRPYQYVCTSILLDGSHQAVIINNKGLFATQQQLQFCNKYPWTPLGSELNAIELPLEQGTLRFAMLTADDANLPKLVKTPVLNDIHVLLVPFDIQIANEVEDGLLSLAASHRICIVAASKEKSFEIELPNDSQKYSGKKNTIKNKKAAGFIANIPLPPGLLPQWKSPKLTEDNNNIIVKYQYGKITKAVIHPIATLSTSQ